MLGVPAPAPRLAALVTAEQGGLVILGAISRQAGSIVYDLELKNTGTAALDGFMIQMNKNAFGLEPVVQSLPIQQGALLSRLSSLAGSGDSHASDSHCWLL